MEIVENILVNNPCFKSGRKIEVKGLMLHSVCCPQPSAEVFIHKRNRPEETRECMHASIDVITGKVYQTLPWEHRHGIVVEVPIIPISEWRYVSRLVSTIPWDAPLAALTRRQRWKW